MAESKCQFSHSVFINNPIEFRTYVHKYVEIETTEGGVFEGTVYTIDPVSESVILVNKCEGKLSMEIIMGHAVKSIQFKKSIAEPTEDIFLQKENQMTPEEVEKLKEKLKSWLIKNRTPIEEDGPILKIGKVIEIHPPYGVDNCISNNEIILARIQKLIQSMSDDISTENVPDQQESDISE